MKASEKCQNNLYNIFMSLIFYCASQCIVKILFWSKKSAVQKWSEFLCNILLLIESELKFVYCSLCLECSLLWLPHVFLCPCIQRPLWSSNLNLGSIIFYFLILILQSPWPIIICLFIVFLLAVKYKMDSRRGYVFFTAVFSEPGTVDSQ